MWIRMKSYFIFAFEISVIHFEISAINLQLVRELSNLIWDTIACASVCVWVYVCVCVCVCVYVCVLVTALSAFFIMVILVTRYNCLPASTADITGNIKFNFKSLCAWDNCNYWLFSKTACHEHGSATYSPSLHTDIMRYSLGLAWTTSQQTKQMTLYVFLFLWLSFSFTLSRNLPWLISSAGHSPRISCTSLHTGDMCPRISYELFMVPFTD